MKRLLFTNLMICSCPLFFSQINPAISSWLQNTSGIMGSHYVSGNSTVIQDNVQANIQTVQYSNNWAYVTTNGIPAYPTGPFLDGNPSLATDQNAIFKIPLYSDGSIYAKAWELKKEWHMTTRNISYHMSWDLYHEDNPYYQWKRSNRKTIWRFVKESDFRVII
jgi:hypothetical protein